MRPKSLKIADNEVFSCCAKRMFKTLNETEIFGEKQSKIIRVAADLTRPYSFRNLL